MMNRLNEISKSFNECSSGYEGVAKVQAEIGRRLFERLDYLTLSPTYVLDLGCGSGYFSALLKKKYPKATIIAIDLAFDMLKTAKKRQGLLKKWPLVNANMMQLPFQEGLFDLVFSNQAIHWAIESAPLFRELHRVMAVHGCFMFSTLGPDTFMEYRKAWAKADTYAHAMDFQDMHDLGDVLLREHFVDPVMDMEKLVVRYDSAWQLLDSLKAQGVRNLHAKRNKGLTGKASLKAFIEAYEAFRIEEKLPLTYEAVYGHAWKGQTHQRGTLTETFFSVEQLRQQRLRST